MGSPSSSKQDDNTKEKILDRNRDSLLYDDEDVNTSIPKLEKLIGKDKERIDREKEERSGGKNKKETQNKKKLEASADKFKAFLSTDINTNDNNNRKTDDDDPKNAKADEKSSVDENERERDIYSVSTESLQSSESVMSTTHSTPSGSRKRLSTEDDSPVRAPPKRNRITDDEDDDAIPMHMILRGIVFVISGIQVRSLLSFHSRSNPQFIDFRIQIGRIFERKEWIWGQNISPIGMILAHI